MNFRKYICFEIETSGLNEDKDEILFIKAIKVVDNKIENTFERYIKPNSEVSQTLLDFLGIDKELLDNGVTIKQAFAEFKEFAKDCVVIDYYGKFNLSFISKIGGLENDYLDLFPIVERLFPKAKRIKLNYILNNFFSIKEDNQLLGIKQLYEKINKEITKEDFFKL